MTMAPTPSILMRIGEVVFKAILVVFVLCMIGAIIDDISLHFITFVGRKAYSLLNPAVATDSSELPDWIEMTMDGVSKNFNKGTLEYGQLVILLHRKISLPDGSTGKISPISPCGEMFIRQYGIPFHFPLFRSKEFQNLYMIELPEYSERHGTAKPFIIDDGALAQFIHDRKE
jgi:hypothetical protein